MAMQFNGYVGFRKTTAGIVQTGTNYYLPAVSCSIDQIENKNYPLNIHGGSGAGTFSAAEFNSGTISWSIGAVEYSGTLEVPLASYYGAALLEQLVGEERDYYFPLVVYNGQNLWYYHACKARTVRISANMGGYLSLTADLIACKNDLAYVRSETSAIPEPSAASWIDVATTADMDPIPYWCTLFGTAVYSAKVTQWELSINNNLYLLQTYNNTPYLQAAQGAQREVTGSYTMYCPLDDLPTTPVLGATDIECYKPSQTQTQGATPAFTINLGNVILDQYREPLTNVQQKLLRQITFHSLNSTITPNIAVT